MATQQRICRIRVLAKMAFFGNVSDSPDSPTFAKPCRADSPESPTFAEPCCADSPDSPTFAKPCCADSPDSRKASLASFMRIQRVWRIWRVQARPFYAYKICNLCLKRPILSCALAPSGLARTRQTRRHSPCHVERTRQTRRHSPSCVARTCQTRRHSPSRVARTRQTRRHSPKTIFEKNVTRLDTFAGVIRHSREFGASGHCLIIIQIKKD